MPGVGRLRISAWVNRMEALLIVLLLLPSATTPTSAQIQSEPVELDVLETVFRHQMARCYKGRRPRTYFLSYRGHDPSEALMSRFGDAGPRARARSQMSGFKDKQTGERGILLSVGDVRWSGSREATVTGTCGAALLDAYSYSYRVVRRDGKWVVTRSKLTGIA
jgi:hypothetical protein